MNTETQIHVPLDVPAEKHEEYLKNLNEITQGTGKLILFAGDQKIEHLNDDYVGEDVDTEDADPEHLFKIASMTKVSCFATQLELIAKYGVDYPNIPYIIKLNSKTNIVKDATHDPLSLSLVSMDEVLRFKEQSKLNIVGVGYTIFLGSEFESEMLREAEHFIVEAHQNGLLAVVWMYPRGKSVENKLDPHLIAGATGVALSIGADFVKVNYPKVSENDNPVKRAEAFKEAVVSAGRTYVICSGGEKMESDEFISQLWHQMHISGSAGCAIGRNLHQRSLAEAKRFAEALHAIVYEDASIETAKKIFSDGVLEN
jgi:fructose-bisphosphate aldolase / 6-deoxy-5-ketofructose 1-phosphate synthase